MAVVVTERARNDGGEMVIHVDIDKYGVESWNFESKLWFVW